MPLVSQLLNLLNTKININRIKIRHRYLKPRKFEHLFPEHQIIHKLDNLKSIEKFEFFQEDIHIGRNYSLSRFVFLIRDEVYDLIFRTIDL